MCPSPTWRTSSHFLIVYLDADPKGHAATAKLLDRPPHFLPKLSRRRRSFPSFFARASFPLTSGRPPTWETLRGENGIEKQIFHRCRIFPCPTPASMAHQHPPDSPAIVLVDAEGKTLYQPGDGKKSVTPAMFAELEAYLDSHFP